MVTTPLDKTFGINDGVLARHEDNRQEGFITADPDTALVEASRLNPEPPGLKYIRPEFYDSLRTGASVHA
jgi:hypothetical protein